MEKVGILIVSKCLSGAAIVDTLARSEKYVPEFYVVEKETNPFISKRASVHEVSPDLRIEDVRGVAKRYRDRIAFGLTDTEDFVVAGGRDVLESETGVPMICVSKKYAVEGSKAYQRLLFDRIFTNANPAYKIFDPREYSGVDEAILAFRRVLSEVRAPVIKPDAPARGAGVGVWGGDFRTEEAAGKFFVNLLSKGRVVVEERVEGEESSFHAFSDGKHFVPTPLTRDYKRSEEGDRGSLTGGMGSYRGPSAHLPFLSATEYEELVAEEERAFRRWKGKGSNPGLRGIVLYDAIMHTGKGFKVLERNSRGGNTELINLLTTLADDFIDVCFSILDGTLHGIAFRRAASVATCAVPLSYGSKRGGPQNVKGNSEKAEEGVVDLSGIQEMEKTSVGSMKAYPMDIHVDNLGRTALGQSRAIAVVGVAHSLNRARELSLAGCNSLIGPLRWRRDIASPADLKRSRDHLMELGSQR